MLLHGRIFLSTFRTFAVIINNCYYKTYEFARLANDSAARNPGRMMMHHETAEPQDITNP